MMALLWIPPSYGRGPAGEVWKLEEQLYSLVELCLPILSENPLFFLLNSYTTGLSPSVMEYLLGVLLQKRFGGIVSADENRPSCYGERTKSSMWEYSNLARKINSMGRNHYE